MLQTDTIFMQVGKGLAAKQEDLEECFKTSDRKKIVQEVRLSFRFVPMS